MLPAGSMGKSINQEKNMYLIFQGLLGVLSPLFVAWII